MLPWSSTLTCLLWVICGSTCSPRKSAASRVPLLPLSNPTLEGSREVLIQELLPPWRGNIHSNAFYAIFRFIFYRCWLCSFVYTQDLGEQEQISATFAAWTEGLPSHWKSLRHTNQHAMGYVPELETKVRRHLLLYCLWENYNCPEFFHGGKRIIGQEVVKLLRASKIGKRFFSPLSSCSLQIHTAQVMADELLGWEWDFAHMPYTDRWRWVKPDILCHSIQMIATDDTADFFINTFKHEIWQCFTLSKRKWQLPSLPSLLIPRITSLLILNSTFITILNSILSKFLCRYVASIALRAAYGYEVKEESDFYIKLVHSAMEPLHPVIHATRSSLVDFVPSLKFIPCAYKLRFLHQNFYSVTYG